MKLKLKSLFFVFFLTIFSLAIIGCSKTKSGPAESGDKVFLEYNATFDKYPDIIYDTTNPKVNKTVKDSNNALGYNVFVIGNDDSISKDLQEAVIGMKAGDTKKITLKPSQLTKTGYDDKNIVSEPGFIYEKSNIKLKKGEIKIKSNKYIRVKSILGKGKTQKVMFDMNSLDTYNDVTYEIKLLQVGGNELEKK